MQGRGRQWRRLAPGLRQSSRGKGPCRSAGRKVRVPGVHPLPDCANPRQAATLRRANLLRTLRLDRCSRPLPSDHRRPCRQQCLREELEKWISVSHQVTEFSYYGDDCIKRFLYRPIPDVIVADYRYYERVKLAGHFVLSTNPQSWWSHAVTLYACARAGWDRDLDAPQIEANYYHSLFGPAAEAMRKHAAILDALHEVNPVSANAEQHAAILRRYAEGIRNAKASLESAQSTNPKPYVAERIRKLQIATDYLDLWFQIQCDQHRFAYREKSAELRDRILANIDRALKLEVITQDDAKGYGTGVAVLNSMRKCVAATPCQPAQPSQKNGK